MKKDSKKTLILVLATAGCVISLLIMAVMAFAVIFPLFRPKNAAKGEKKTEETIHYVSDYPITNGQTLHHVYDTWSVRKRETDGLEYLYVWDGGMKESEIEHLHFVVYDDASDARSNYESMYERYSEYTKLHGGWGWEEGVNWFTAQEPDVCDASVVQIICLEQNVIITADIQVTSEWGMVDDTTYETTTLPADYFDIATLKDYVIDNSEEIRDFVLNVILNRDYDPDLGDVEIRDGYVAVLRGGAGEITYQTYVYEMAVGYRYINTTSTTESWGSTNWNTVVDSEGYLDTKEEVVEVARDHNSCDCATYPGDSRTYTVEDFLSDK